MTDITRFRGDTSSDHITVQTLSGTPVDITGYTFVLTVNSLENPPDNTTEIYSIAGSILSGPAGTVEFVPTAGNADQLAAEYYYDIQMIDAASRIKTIEKGKYTYTQDISK